mmetsp:Transcript_19391/g.62124  ORF Transcript_19391/g.62124 Transcript_19391/m.62124 type:complete len:266 (-) Transcript_19391:1919-2716(-)
MDVRDGEAGGLVRGLAAVGKGKSIADVSGVLEGIVPQSLAARNVLDPWLHDLDQGGNGGFRNVSLVAVWRRETDPQVVLAEQIGALAGGEGGVAVDEGQRAFSGGLRVGAEPVGQPFAECVGSRFAGLVRERVDAGKIVVDVRANESVHVAAGAADARAHKVAGECVAACRRKWTAARSMADASAGKLAQSAGHAVGLGAGARGETNATSAVHDGGQTGVRDVPASAMGLRPRPHDQSLTVRLGRQSGSSSSSRRRRRSDEGQRR